MKKIKSTIILFTVLLVSCSVKTNHESLAIDQRQPPDAALKFINEYTKACSGTDFNSAKWIESNELITDNFKVRYKQIVEEARKADPEVGLAFDPIFNAQDYPEKGFMLSGTDDNGYVTVKGKDWQEFTVVIKLAFIDNLWKVDGAGIINIPKNKQVNQ